MYVIEKTVELSPGVKSFVVQAPRVARKCQPGQFIILRTNEDGERIPLTIADFDRANGTITLIFQEVGCSTRELGKLQAGDALLDVAGPLGNASHIGKFGTVVCVGGGIGVAPVYPIARAYHQAGNKVVSIIGARNKDLLILEQEMAAVSDILHITTDDGSKGHKGLVVDPLRAMIEAGEQIDLVMAIGPVVMMRGVAEVTRPHQLKTIVSVGSANKFACVDGPEFDAHQVDFAGLMARQRMYAEQEKQERKCGGECSCK